MVDYIMLKEVCGEFFCTLIFILTICASGLSMSTSSSTGNSYDITAAICTTITAMALIFIFGNISGAHFNPAVTIGLMVLGIVKPIKGLLYILVQFIAAMLACSILLIFYDDLSQLIFNSSEDQYKDIFILEFILTSILVFVVGMRVWYPAEKEKKAMAIAEDSEDADAELGAGNQSGISSHSITKAEGTPQSLKNDVESIQGEETKDEEISAQEKIKSDINLLITAGSIASTLGFLCFLSGQLGTAYFNPARALGPIIANSMSSGDDVGWSSIYVYFFGNIGGSLFGAALCYAFKR